MDETQQVENNLFDEAVRDVFEEYRLMRERLRILVARLQAEEWRDLYRELPQTKEINAAAQNAESLITLIRDHEAKLGKTCNSAVAGGGESVLRLDDAKSEVFGRLARIRERRGD